MVKLGKPYNEEVMPLANPKDKYKPYRHKDEISAYCCGEPRCAGYLEVHEKVRFIRNVFFVRMMFDFYLFLSRYSMILKEI